MTSNADSKLFYGITCRLHENIYDSALALLVSLLQTVILAVRVVHRCRPILANLAELFVSIRVVCLVEKWECTLRQVSFLVCGSLYPAAATRQANRTQQELFLSVAKPPQFPVHSLHAGVDRRACKNTAGVKEAGTDWAWQGNSKSKTRRKLSLEKPPTVPVCSLQRWGHRRSCKNAAGMKHDSLAELGAKTQRARLDRSLLLNAMGAWQQALACCFDQTLHLKISSRSH